MKIKLNSVYAGEIIMTKNNQKKKRDLVVARVFDAPVELAWKAWIEPELVMQWWGPDGFTSPSAEIDFREDGKLADPVQMGLPPDFPQDMRSVVTFKDLGNGKYE